MSLVVEFFGLPGSGKTHAANELVLALGARGVEVVQPNRLHQGAGPVSRSTHKLRSALGHRRLLVAVAGVLLRSPRSGRDKLAVARFLVATVERYDAARRDSTPRVYVFDEGTVQRAFMLFVERDGVAGQPFLERYAREVPTADVLVHVPAEHDGLVRRLRDRDRGLPGRLEGLDEQVLLGLFSDASDLLLALAHRRETGARSGDAPSVLTFTEPATLARDVETVLARRGLPS